MFIKKTLLTALILTSTSFASESNIKKASAAGVIIHGTILSVGAGSYLSATKNNLQFDKKLALASAERKRLFYIDQLKLEQYELGKIAAYEAQIKTAVNSLAAAELEHELYALKNYPSYVTGDKQKFIDQAIAEFEKAKLIGSKASMNVIAARAFFLYGIVEAGLGIYFLD